MAQGKEFLGVRGKEVGIVHEIGTLETALAYGEKRMDEFKAGTADDNEDRYKPESLYS